jgi:hypothetical protein
MMVAKDYVRFFDKFKASRNGCWEWTCTKAHFGHGKFKLNGKQEFSHRLMYSMTHPKEDIKDSVIRHSCDNPGCVNPDHLIKGTQKDNIQDQFDRGRHFSQKQTHCKNGHEYTDETRYLNPKTGHRQCLICKKAARRRFFLATGN